MYFYEILQDIMNEKNLKVADVAKLCGLSDSTVRSVFSRKQKTVALDVAFKLSDGLNVSLRVLNGDVSLLSMDNNLIILSDMEKELIKAYRNHPEHKQTIDKILDIEESKPNKPPAVFRTINTNDNSAALALQNTTVKD